MRRKEEAQGSQEGMWLNTCSGTWCHEVEQAPSCFPNLSSKTAQGGNDSLLG